MGKEIVVLPVLCGASVCWCLMMFTCGHECWSKHTGGLPSGLQIKTTLTNGLLMVPPLGNSSLSSGYPGVSHVRACEAVKL